jgi:hypothetical protein
MSDKHLLEQELRAFMVELCAVLYRHGYQTVSLGALMRLVGIHPGVASEHDDTIIELGSEFKEILQTVQAWQGGDWVAAEKTLH